MTKRMAEPKVKEERTKAQRALELKTKLAALEEEAKAELLETANQTLKELGELGFIYHLLSDDDYHALRAPVAPILAHSKPKTPKADKPAPLTPSSNYNPDKKCEVCGINSHDGRAHRTHKEKFTQQELADRGLLPPA